MTMDSLLKCHSDSRHPLYFFLWQHLTLFLLIHVDMCQLDGSFAESGHCILISLGSASWTDRSRRVATPVRSQMWKMLMRAETCFLLVSIWSRWTADRRNWADDVWEMERHLFGLLTSISEATCQIWYHTLSKVSIWMCSNEKAGLFLF